MYVVADRITMYVVAAATCGRRLPFKDMRQLIRWVAAAWASVRYRKHRPPPRFFFQGLAILGRLAIFISPRTSRIILLRAL